MKRRPSESATPQLARIGEHRELPTLMITERLRCATLLSSHGEHKLSLQNTLISFLDGKHDDALRGNAGQNANIIIALKQKQNEQPKAALKK